MSPRHIANEGETTMKKHTIAAFGLFLLPNLGFAEGLNRTCWNGFFSYNTLTIEETSDSYQIGLSGSDFGPLIFNQYNEISISPPNLNRARVYVSFPKNECQLDGNLVSCQSTGERATVYISKYFENLGQPTTVIQSASVEKVSVEANETYAQLNFWGGRNLGKSHDEEDVQTVTIGQRLCAEGGEETYPSAHFPPQLEAYLAGQ